MKILHEVTNLKQTTSKTISHKQLKDELYDDLKERHNAYNKELDTYVTKRCTHFGVHYDEMHDITMQMLNARLGKAKVRF